MGRPKVSDENKHRIHVCVYMNEFEKDEFTNRIESDPQNSGLGMSKVINKLIREYVKGHRNNHASSSSYDRLAPQEAALIDAILSDSSKKEILFRYINDSKSLS